MASIYPRRTRNVCEFFESIGVDPHTVLDVGISQDGYYQKTDTSDYAIGPIVEDEPPSRLVPWAKPEDFEAFLVAEQQDYTWQVTQGGARECPHCGHVL